MKEQVLMYIGCALISFFAVTVTSLIKLIVCNIASKCGRNLSGNVKEYVFAPMAIIVAAIGLYFWLDKLCRLIFDEKFMLIVGCFSIGTMLLYLLLFQSTRKIAVKIIQAITKKFKIPEVVEEVKDVLTDAEIIQNKGAQECNLQSNAKKDETAVAVTEKPPDTKVSTDSEADKLRAMVEQIKNK